MNRRQFLKICLVAVVAPIAKLFKTDSMHMGVDMATGKDCTVISHWKPVAQIHDSILYEHIHALLQREKSLPWDLYRWNVAKNGDVFHNGIAMEAGHET